MKETEQTYTADDWGVGKVIELKDGGGNSCRCSFPLRDGQDGWPIKGTLKVETSTDGVTFVDITSRLDEGPGNYPRFVIAGKMPSVTTKLYLGPITGDDTDYTAGKSAVRIRYCYPVANFGVEGAHHPLEPMCHWSKRDYTNWVGTGTTITAKDINSDGEHFFCFKHRSIPAANRENYTWDCAQCGSCPLFELRQLSRVNEQVIAQMTSNTNLGIQQMGGGESGVMSWVWLRATGGTPSIEWLFNTQDFYQFNYNTAYTSRYLPLCGGFYYVPTEHVGTVEVRDPETNELLGYDEKVAHYTGAHWNLYGTDGVYDWSDPSKRFIDMQGALSRRLAFIPLTQLSEEPDDDNDPANQCRYERIMRRTASAHRERIGLAYTTRSTTGLEGENRLQRVRTKTRYLSAVDKNKTGIQGLAGTRDDSITFYPAPITYAGISDVRAIIKLLPDGKLDHGYKKLGQGGTNGQAWRVADVGGGLFDLHCSPGLWYATRIESVGGGGSYTKYTPWWGSGNVVELPPKHGPYHTIGNLPNATLVGSLARKAVAGDTVTFSYGPLAGRRYWVVKAEPSCGDTFSGEMTDTYAFGGRLGPVINMQDLVDTGGKLEISKYETQFTGSTIGTWHDLTPAYVKAMLDSERRYDYMGVDPLLGDPLAFFDLVTVVNDALYSPTVVIYNGGEDWGGRTVLWSAAPHGLKVGDMINIKNAPLGEANGNHAVYAVASATLAVLNHTDLSYYGQGAGAEFIPLKTGYYTQLGSGRVTFHPSLLGMVTLNPGILLGEYNRVRITPKVNGAELEPREVAIKTPCLDVPPMPSSDIVSVQVWHQRRDTGEWHELYYAGTSATEYDLFLNENPFGYRYIVTAGNVGKFLFHPLLAGDEVFVQVRMAYPVAPLDGLGEPGLWYGSFQQNIGTTHLKQCDVITLKDDDAGLLAAHAGSLAGATFYVSTAGVIAP